MDKLGLDYLDMYVIHQPYHDYFGAWKAMEELYEEGLVRSISVDNFTQDRLADFMFWNKIKPAANLLECNPFFQRGDEEEYLKEQNILMQAWSPLAAGQDDLLSNPTLCSIANAHSKSPAQIVLRWLIQRGILPLVKTSNPKRMRENLEVFDFELTDDEVKQITKLDKGHTCFMPRNTGKQIIDVCRERFSDRSVNWFMDVSNFRELDDILKEEGYRIKTAHPFFIPRDDSACEISGTEIKKYNQQEILQFKDDDRFDEAFCFSEESPDVLAVAAIVDDEIVGMAGASADSPAFWQIGINVNKEFEGRHIASALVSIIKNDILQKGIVPYYGTSFSNLASQHVAAKAEFEVAWVELLTEIDRGL